MNIGFVGTGVITDAIIRGMLAYSDIEGDILVSRRSASVSAALAQLSDRVKVCDDNQEVVDGADLVFLAVLPQVAKEVVSPLGFREGQQVCSVIATHTIETLQNWIAAPVHISRAIPLPSVKEGMGTTVLLDPSAEIQSLFGALGSALVAPDLAAFDAYASASATMGSYFGILETVAGWMQTQGCREADAQAYLTQIFAGLSNRAQLARGENFAQLREAHSTPGGLNEQVFSEFAAAGGPRALTDALDSVAKRIRDAAHE